MDECTCSPEARGSDWHDNFAACVTILPRDQFEALMAELDREPRVLPKLRALVERVRSRRG